MALALARRRPAAARHDVLAFVADAETRQAVGSAFGAAGLNAAVLDGGLDAALKQVEPESGATVIVVDIAGAAAPVPDIAALAAAADPGTRLVAIGAVNDIALYRDLVGAGAADYLVKPVDPALLLAAVAERQPDAKAGGAAAGRVSAIVGVRGGVGATTVAVNLAWLLAGEHKVKTALVDLDVHFGTAALALDLEPGRGLREALERPGRIDALFIERAMVRATDRLFVLGGEEPLADTAALDPAAGAALLAELRRSFAHVVVDLPRPVLLADARILASVNDLVLVCEPSLAGVRDAARLLALARDAAPQARVRIVTTAVAGAKPKLPRAEFGRSIGHVLAEDIPFDPKTAASAANAGKPLSEVGRAAPAVKALRQLAAALVARSDAKPAGLLQRLFRR